MAAKVKKEGSPFGLGHGWYLTDHDTEAILFAMGWDGTQLTPEGASIPYQLTKEWFRQTLTSAVEEAVVNFEASHGRPLVVLQGENQSEADEQEPFAQSA